MIKVLIVEDSQVMRDFLTNILSSDPAIKVIGTAVNGEEAVRAVRDKRPHIVTMDINMPRVNGFEATRLIMEATPTPIVIVSASWEPEEVERTFRAMEVGALAAVQKPVGALHPDHRKQVRELIQTVKLMSEVKVVRRRPLKPNRTGMAGTAAACTPPLPTTGIRTVAIGASTGGPPVIEAILSELPKNFPVPILIVQHISAGFVQGFADWLTSDSGLPVKIAVNDEYPLPGHVYVAPDDVQMGMDVTGRIVLNKSKPENGLRPSVSYMFRSVAEVCGGKAVGVLLTGMGKDGAYELKMMKEKGAVTIVQDRESCLVFGMPGEAVALNAATHVLPPIKIAEFLSGLPAAKASRR